MFDNKVEILPKPESTLYFLTVGRLHWIKGFIETLEALAQLKQNGIKFNYIIIGEGQEFEPIKFAAHQLNIYDEVKLIGKQAHKRVVEYMAQADLYLQYSYSEGFCNAVLEAQAMGCLCVVSDGGGLTENILHGQTGWVVPKRNPKALAEKIKEVINLPEDEKVRIAKQARQRVKDQFNLTKHHREWLEFYQNG
nr:glycosyltransferase [Hanstruepera marina]